MIDEAKATMAPSAYEMVKVLVQSGYPLDDVKGLVNKAFELALEFYIQSGIINEDTGKVDTPKIMKIQ